MPNDVKVREKIQTIRSIYQRFSEIEIQEENRRIIMSRSRMKKVVDITHHTNALTLLSSLNVHKRFSRR